MGIQMRTGRRCSAIDPTEAKELLSRQAAANQPAIEACNLPASKMTDADMKKGEAADAAGPAAKKRECCINSRARLKTRCATKSHQELTYVDVVVIGNGPSGICLSYLLSGHWPYYSRELAHPNEYLHKRLQVEKGKPLILQDLKFLSDDLEGRSPNPVSLLFDTLSNPDADLGRESPPLLHWKHHLDKEISHVVLGKKEEGGIWQMMEGQMKTLSLSNWMQLPDSSFDKWLQENRRFDDPEKFSNRARMEEVRKYYYDYVQEKNLKKYFSNHSTVTSVQRIQEYEQTTDDESGEDCMSCESRSRSRETLWLVFGHRVIYDSNGEPEMEEDFCYKTPNLVLATGSFDQPNTLRVPGENLPYVCHSLPELEHSIRSECLGSESDPVVVIGAGLSAADAILHLLSLNVPVIHILRRDADDLQVIYRQLPPKLYPEYHKVYRLMQRKDTDDRYKNYSVMDIVEFTNDKQILLRSRQTGQETVLQTSCAVVLIGSRPDLSFMPTNVLFNLGVVPGMGIHSPHNPIDVDPYTYQSNRYPGLYAMGPLVGDGFVRFLRGGALGIVSHLWQKQDDMR